VLEPKNVCRSGERIKMYIGMKYRDHVTMLESFGRDILADGWIGINERILFNIAD
jgi:hypothetical protein